MCLVSISEILLCISFLYSTHISMQIKYILESQMVECSTKSFIHTEIQKLIFLHLLTDLFCKDSSHLLARLMYEVTAIYSDE